MNYKKLIVKALVTFVQALAGYLVVADGLNKALIAGAVGSALSVVWNTVLYPQLQTYLNSSQK